jgi:O-antigen/teichoic acid export membrane protein
MEQDHRKLAKGVLVNILGMLAKSSRPIFLVIFSRMLGAEKFGLYMLAFATQEIVSKLAALGLDQGVTRLVGRLRAQGRDQDVRAVVQKSLMVGIMTSAVVALVLGLSAGRLSQLLLGTDRLVSPLRNFCWGMPALVSTTMILYAIRPTLRMQYELYVRSVAEPVIILALGAFALYKDFGVPGLAIVHNLAAFVTLVLAWTFFLRVYPASRGPVAPVDWKLLWHTSLPMGGMECLGMFKLKLDLMVIGRFMPLTSVGIYSAVVEISSILRKLRATFDPVLGPIAQIHHEREETDRLNRNLALALRWVMIPSLALFGIMLLLPEMFLRFFGEAFKTGAVALRVFAFGQLVFVTLGLLEGVLAIVGFAYVTLINAVVLILVNLVLLRLMVPIWGIEGAAWATCASFTAIALWRLAQARKLVGVRPFEKSQIKPILAFAIAMTAGFAALKIFRPEALVAQIALSVGFLLVYFAAVLGLRVEERDLDIVQAVKRRFPIKWSR